MSSDLSRTLLDQDGVSKDVNEEVSQDNPYKKVKDVIAEEKKRNAWAAWTEKAAIKSDLLLVSNVIDRVKACMGPLFTGAAAFKANYVEFEFWQGKLGLEDGDDTHPSFRQLRVEYEKVCNQLYAVLKEMMTFSHGCRFDFLQYIIAEILDAQDELDVEVNQDQFLRSVEGIALYTCKDGPSVQRASFREQLPYLNVTQVFHVQAVTAVALPHFLPALMELQSSLAAQVQMADDIQSKFMAAGVSVGIAVSQLVATRVAQSFFPSCTHICLAQD